MTELMHENQHGQDDHKPEGEIGKIGRQPSHDETCLWRRAQDSKKNALAL